MIEKELLIDTIIVISDDHDGNTPIINETIIDNVRISKDRGIRSNPLGESLEYSRKIYYDLKHSTKFDFLIGQRIKIADNNDTLEIIKIVEGRSNKLESLEIYVK